MQPQSGTAVSLVDKRKVFGGLRLPSQKNVAISKRDSSMLKPNLALNIN